MKISFPYRKEQGVTGEILRPIAAVYFINGENIVFEYPYADPGADITLLPHSVGAALGLKSEGENIINLRGISETAIPIIIKQVQAKIGGFEFPIRIAWAQIEEVPLLLGRADILDNFKITFKKDQVVFETLPARSR